MVITTFDGPPNDPFAALSPGGPSDCEVDCASEIADFSLEVNLL